jgi:hypothetical protein
MLHEVRGGAVIHAPQHDEDSRGAAGDDVAVVGSSGRFFFNIRSVRDASSQQ